MTKTARWLIPLGLIITLRYNRQNYYNFLLLEQALLLIKFLTQKNGVRRKQVNTWLKEEAKRDIVDKINGLLMYEGEGPDGGVAMQGVVEDFIDQLRIYPYRNVQCLSFYSLSFRLTNANARCAIKS